MALVDYLAEVSKQDVPTFHFSAWEQAVFVCLIIALVGLMLRWQSKESKAARDFQAKQDVCRQENELERDKQWREWMDRNQLHNDERLNAVQQSLEGLTLTIKLISVQIDAHRAEFAQAQLAQQMVKHQNRAKKSANEDQQ